MKIFLFFYEENSDKLIILDEVQRLPEVFPKIRGLIDKQRRNGNKTGLFIFLGSASIELLKQSSESLRVAFHCTNFSQLTFENLQKGILQKLTSFRSEAVFRKAYFLKVMKIVYFGDVILLKRILKETSLK